MELLILKIIIAIGLIAILLVLCVAPRFHNQLKDIEKNENN